MGGTIVPVSTSQSPTYNKPIYMAAAPVPVDNTAELIATQEKLAELRTLYEKQGLEILRLVNERDSDNQPAAAATVSTVVPETLYDQAVALVLRDGKASAWRLQHQLHIGQKRACSLLEQMEQDRIVSPQNSSGRRTVIGSLKANRDTRHQQALAEKDAEIRRLETQVRRLDTEVLNATLSDKLDETGTPLTWEEVAGERDGLISNLVSALNIAAMHQRQPIRPSGAAGAQSLAARNRRPRVYRPHRARRARIRPPRRRRGGMK
jgi:hypothetical protein